MIASELPDNPGTSITNMAEQLATIVARQFELDPARLTWIEHYPADPDLERDESYDLVRFAWDGERFSDPQWKRVERAAVERLIGQPLSDGAAAARGGALMHRAVNEGPPMLTEGQWYALPGGTLVQAHEQTIRGTWHLCTADGTPAYVVFGGTQIRRLVFTAIVTDNPGVEGPTPGFQAVPCDLTRADLRPAPKR